MIDKFLKSVIDQDDMPIVICDLTNTVIYMNPESISRYKKNMVGESIFNCHDELSSTKLKMVVDWFNKSEDNNIIHTMFSSENNKDIYMVALRDNGKLIGYYEKHIVREKDEMKFYDMK